MINKSHFKFYLLPGGILVLILLIILIVPMGNKTMNEQGTIPIPTSSTFTTDGPTPTLIPLRFTGADLIDDIPQDIRLFSQQKTELRRQAPLELTFGTISFDYENDSFVLALKEPKNESQTDFNNWLKQTYPAIPVEQFAIQ